MKTLPVLLLEGAIQDLTDIASYINSESGEPAAASDFIARIQTRCNKIGLAPNGGTNRPDLGQGIQLVPFEKSAVILYRIIDNSVHIVNVFYGGRNYDAIMRGK